MPNEVKLLPCEMKRAFDELRVAADVCELDDNTTVIRQAARIRSAHQTIIAYLTRPTIVTDEVVERVARAMCTEECGYDEDWRTFIRHARKALAAMPAIVGGE